MTDPSDTTPPSATTSAEPTRRRRWVPWLQLAAIAVSFAVIGFVGGWFVRGEGGSVTQLAPATADVTAAGDMEADEDEPVMTEEVPPEPPPRGEVALVVLNGGTVDGLAAQTADRAETLGYEDVISDNAPTQTGPTVVYYTAGNRVLAERVATDLEFGPVEELPGSGPLAQAVRQAAPGDSDVIVVLGTA